MRRSILAAAMGFIVLLAGGLVIRCAGQAESSFLEIGLLATVACSGLATALALCFLEQAGTRGAARPRGTLFRVLLDSCAPAVLLGTASAVIFVLVPAKAGARLSLIEGLVRVHGQSIGWVPVFSGLAAVAFAVALLLLDKLRGALRQRLLWSLSAAHLVAAATLAGIVAFIVIGGGEGAALIRVVKASQGPTEMIARVIILLLWALLFYAVIATMALAAALPLSLAFSRIATGGAVRRLAALLDFVESFDPSSIGVVRIPIERPDEIGRLQRSFNTMAERLEKASADLREERDRNEDLLRSRRELMARLSHDLRTPIANLLALFESEAHVEAERGETGALARLAIMDSQLRSLQSLTEDLIDAARGDAECLAVHPHPIDPAPLLESVVAAFEPLARASGGILIACEASPLPLGPRCLSLDARLLDRTVSNLLRNALRHTGPGGIVLVRGARTGERYAIEVRNSIASAELAVMSDSAGSLSSSGLQLGLILAKEYAEAMRGEFSFGIEEDGALARVVFPLCDSSATDPR